MPRPPDTDHSHLAFAIVLLATVSIAFKGIFAALAYTAGMTVAAVLMLRVFMALPLFWGAGYWLPAPSGTVHIPFSDWIKALLVGNFFTLATIADFIAIERLGASLSRVVLFTFPLIVQLMTAVRLRRLPTRVDYLTFVLCYTGLLLLFLPEGLEGRMDAAVWGGIAWSFTAAVAYACYLVLGQSLATRMGSARFSSLANTAPAIAFLIYALVWARAEDFQIPPDGLLWVTLMVVISTVLPFLLMFEGIRRIGADKASLITLLGPAVTLLAAWMILDERLVLLQWAGFGLVLAGMLVLQFGGRLFMR